MKPSRVAMILYEESNLEKTRSQEVTNRIWEEIEDELTQYPVQVLDKYGVLVDDLKKLFKGEE